MDPKPGAKARKRSTQLVTEPVTDYTTVARPSVRGASELAKVDEEVLATMASGQAVKLTLAPGVSGPQAAAQIKRRIMRVLTAQGKAVPRVRATVRGADVHVWAEAAPAGDKKKK